VDKLPSPLVAQSTRMLNVWPALFEGEPRNAVYAAARDAISRCDTSSSIVTAFVSKVVSVDDQTIKAAEYMRKTNTALMQATAEAMAAAPSIETSIQTSEESIDAPEGAVNAVSLQDPLVSVVQSESDGAQEARSEQSTPMAMRRSNESERFIAFARVFSGTLRAGSTIHILGPRYDLE